VAQPLPIQRVSKIPQVIVLTQQLHRTGCGLDNPPGFDPAEIVESVVRRRGSERAFTSELQIMDRLFGIDGRPSLIEMMSDVRDTSWQNLF